MAFSSQATNEKGMHADPEGIHTDGQQTIVSADEFRGYIDSLAAHVQELLSIWSGAGASEFSNSYNEQNVKLREFQTVLDDFGVAIIKAGRILGTSDEEAAFAAKTMNQEMTK